MKYALGLLLAAAIAVPGLALSLSGFSGTWEANIDLLPAPPHFYSSVLTISTTLGGFKLESESKFYSSGYKYQNFYLSGTVGSWNIWGKIYFHAQEVRYQKLWLNFKLPLSGEGNYLQLSVDHWATSDDYFSSDEDMFGPWPCGVVTWDEAHNHYHETLHVQGPVDSVYVSGHGNVTIHLGLPYGNPNRFDIYIPASYVDDFKAVFGDDFPDNLVGKTVCIYGYIKTYHGIYEIESHDPADLKIGKCCGVPNAFGPLLIYRGKLVLQPLTLTVDFADCCTGTWFKQLELELSDLPLCCGLTYDADFLFSKCHGFEYAKFSVDNLFDLCCDISFGASVEFGVDHKAVTITPSWNGGEGCVTVYGNVDWNNNAITGWSLYGWKIGCQFSDCNKLTLVTAFKPEYFWNVDGELVVSEERPTYGYYYFHYGEFEAIKFETCGAACCGGNWSLDVQTFFDNGGGLFGISRTDVKAEIPVMDALSFSIDTELNSGGMAHLYLGWTFKF